MNIWLVFAFLFFIGSCSGWCLELVYRRFFSGNNPGRKWINPGFLVGPWLPLYGFGLFTVFVAAYLTENMLDSLNLSFPVYLALLFVTIAILMTVIEYIAGRIFIIGMNIKLWDYTDEKLNLQGIICPKFSCYWGIMGCFYCLVIHPHVTGWVDWLAQNLAFSFFIGVFFGFFIIDCSYSFNLSMKIRSFAKEKEIVVRYEELKNFLDEKREEMEQKKQFMLAFNTREPIREHLEEYLERKTEKGKEILENIKSEIRENLDEIKESIDELSAEEHDVSAK
ncbi:MAG: hypothetical protein PUB87_02245 [Eubacteriaceae bacterium]|nr:hypothetical protein [Eubacteriaceae bacterium]